MEEDKFCELNNKCMVSFFVAWGPYAYFLMLEAARAQAEAQAAAQPPPDRDNVEEEDGGFMGLHLVDNPSMRREEDVETGRVPPRG